MRLADVAASARIALVQRGLAPRAYLMLAAPADPQSLAKARARRRRRRRLRAAAIVLFVVAAVAVFAPPSHGAMLVVLPPWVDAAEAERWILEAGGLAYSAEDGDVELFGLRVARMAIGADPDFATAALADGVVVLDAGPLFWIDEKIASVAALFGRG